MSVTVRLSQFGKSGQLIYRVVVSETRYKRDGKFLDTLGTYNSNVKPPVIKIDKNRLDAWVKKGAIISTGVRKLLKASPL